MPTALLFWQTHTSQIRFIRFFNWLIRLKSKSIPSRCIQIPKSCSSRSTGCDAVRAKTKYAECALKNLRNLLPRSNGKPILVVGHRNLDCCVYFYDPKTTLFLWRSRTETAHPNYRRVSHSVNLITHDTNITYVLPWKLPIIHPSIHPSLFHSS